MQLFTTHIGRVLVGGVLLLIGGIMSPNGTIGENIYSYGEGDLWVYMFYVGIALFSSEVLLFITYGVIVNPIRTLIEKRKKNK